jgi:hypothetical protein
MVEGLASREIWAGFLAGLDALGLSSSFDPERSPGDVGPDVRGEIEGGRVGSWRGDRP